MTRRQVKDLLRDRFVYYPVQRQWYKAFGGPAVTREQVAKTLKIPDEDLLMHEAIQCDGVDRSSASAVSV